MLVATLCWLKLNRPNHHVRISSSAHQDICFLGWPHLQVHAPKQLLDASDYFYTAWEADFPQIQPWRLYFKELFMLLLAVERWAHLSQNQKIIFYCDNQSCVICINSDKASDLAAVDCFQSLLCPPVLYNCEFKAVHLYSEQKFLIDAF